MRTARSISALIGCATLLGGCGGGGSTPATHTAAATSTATSAPTGTPYATAKLTIKFPANFHTAKKASATTRAAATSTRRSPAYVNPNSNNFIDVYVNGVDETANENISSTGDGTQQISLPIYSASSQQIVAVETVNGVSQGYNAVVLAIGETDLATNSFVAGDVTSISLTMLMNAVASGITSDPGDGSDATIDTSQGNPYLDSFYSCNSYPQNGNFLYLFAADSEGGFYSNAGLGVPFPTLGGYTQQPSTYPIDSVGTAGGNTGLNNGTFEILYGSGSGGLILNALVANPAAAIQQDAYNNQGLYPGIESLYQGGALNPIINSIGPATISTPIYVSPQEDPC